MTNEPIPGWERPLGVTNLVVTAVTAGAAPLGSMPEAFGYEVAEADAIHLVTEILASSIRVIDTSNDYSGGRSEERIGKGIAAAGGVPDGFLIATKVDARDGDYSGARVRQSVAESRRRLGLGVLPMVYLHDPEFHDFEVLTAPGGAIDTLVALRADGEIGHIGVAGGDVRQMQRYLDLEVFEVVLTHNRWTIVDRSAGPLIEDAVAQRVAVVNAAIYGGGILAGPRSEQPRYGYRAAHPATLEAIDRMEALCARWNTDLRTVALQFSLRDPRISSTVVGFSKVERLSSIVTTARTTFPEEFWEEIEALVPVREAWLDAN